MCHKPHIGIAAITAETEYSIAIVALLSILEEWFGIAVKSAVVATAISLQVASCI